MAVNQAQVDHIITAASEDDPEVKLQNLEREVDLIKTSIKRLLMDIRERMNELENPFTLAVSAAGSSAASTDLGNADEVRETKKAAREAKEAAVDTGDFSADAADAVNEKVEKESPKRKEPEVKTEHPVSVTASDEKHLSDEQMMALLKTQMPFPANTHKTG